MWYFISNSFGKSTISNILYLTRINRSLENGLLYVLGFDSKELSRQWQAYYEKKFAAGTEPVTDIQNDLHLSKQRLNIPVGRMRLSPDGQQLAYTLNEHGRAKVMLYDMASGEKEVLFRYGVKNFDQEADLNYPVLTWRKDGKELSFIYERRDVINLVKYDFESGTVFSDKLSPEFYRVFDMDYWSADTLMLNATTDGFTDLYLYAPVTRQSMRLSEDFYDDLDASVVTLNNHRYILFSSNRPNETLIKMELDSLLPIGPFDLFLMDVQGKTRSLRQLTFTSATSERKARLSGNDDLIALSDIDGRWQRIRVSRLSEDPPVINLQARFDRDIKLHEYVPGAPGVIDWFQKWNLPFADLHSLDSLNATYRSALGNNTKNENVVTPINPDATPEEEIDTRYLFQSPFPVPPHSTIKVIKDLTAKDSVTDYLPILQPHWQLIFLMIQMN